jgi:hypothetical protein
MAVIVAALWTVPFHACGPRLPAFFQQKFEPQASTEPMGGCKSPQQMSGLHLNMMLAGSYCH